MPPQRFGKVRQLPSGRHQASYVGPDRQRHTAPSTFPTEKEARLWLREVEKDIGRGWWTPEDYGRRTLREYCEQYLGENPNVGPRWAETCRRNMRLHLAPILDMPVVNVTPPVIRAWHSKALRGTGGRVSIAQSYRFVRSVLTVATNDGAIPRNPCQIKGAGSDLAKERPIASTEEVAALIAQITPRYRAAVVLAAWCGLRRGEVCGLLTEDVDVSAGVVRIRKNWAELLASPEKWLKDPKSAAGKRVVTVPPHVLPVLREHAKEWSGPVFFNVGRDGKPMSGNTVYQAFVRARSRVGVDITFHDLRHTGQSLAAAAGANLADLKKRLGHSTTAASMRYLHAVEGRDYEIARALSQLADDGGKASASGHGGTHGGTDRQERA